jgi:hypothetical protein
MPSAVFVVPGFVRVGLVITGLAGAGLFTGGLTVNVVGGAADG